MMTDIHIPAAALEAGLGAFYIAEADGLTLSDALRAAFEGIVENWEGAYEFKSRNGQAMALPLTEKPDAE